MFFYEADRISASPEYPMTDRFDQLAFPTSDSGGQIQSFDHGLLGFIWESPLLIPVCEATMGQGEPFVQVDRFLKFQFRTMVLGEQSVHTLFQSIRGRRRSRYRTH